MRGEKIPAMIINTTQLNKAFNSSKKPDEVLISNYVEEDLSGWFIIDGLRYIYDPTEAKHGSVWKTEIKCIRREWPISGKSVYKEPKDKETEVVATIDPSTNNAVTDNTPEENVVDTSTNTESVPETSSEKPTTLENVSTMGLEDYMDELWDAITSDAYIARDAKLVQAKWWAVDENGQKTYGYPYIKNGGMYKVMDERGQIRYINTDTWEHFFGQAINVSYAQGPGTLMKDIIQVDWVLDVMYENGLSAYEEKWQSGSIEAKTLHFGTSTIRQKEFWNFVFNIRPECKNWYSDYLAHNYHSKLPDKTHEDIDESTLNQNKS